MEDVVDYLEFVKYPMCLHDMMDKVEDGIYTNVDELSLHLDDPTISFLHSDRLRFMLDICLIADNAASYNDETDPVGRKLIAKVKSVHEVSSFLETHHPWH